MSDANINLAPSQQRVVFPHNRVMRQRPAVRPGQNSATPLDGTESDPDSTSHLPSPPRSGRVYRAFGKRVLDITLIMLAAPLALLLIGAAAIALWIEGGSPFYRQARLGKGGEIFSILKLRTMVHDADRLLEANLAADPALREEWNTTQKLRRDPRITPLGALLRKTSMDELPQLWNVLKGDMSLVGPRPMLPEQLPLYGDAAHYFALRPGITGYWQVSQRNQSAFTARAEQDAAYDLDMSIVQDAKVLWRTIGAVIKQTGY
ncbi:sugar transferase [Roseovarius sp. Pro17]|uniref:sugar transferase n=1 Tax=Roseovarius sp. Pro17 TaxID=3108175 RepID=UPI002D7751B0|nr:sugar transferase [Roseovarius sp. Pro17]